MHLELTFRILYFSLRDFSLKMYSAKITGGGLSVWFPSLATNSCPDSNSSGSTASVYKIRPVSPFCTQLYLEQGGVRSFQKFFSNRAIQSPPPEKYIPFVGGAFLPCLDSRFAPQRKICIREVATRQKESIMISYRPKVRSWNSRKLLQIRIQHLQLFRKTSIPKRSKVHWPFKFNDCFNTRNLKLTQKAYCRELLRENVAWRGGGGSSNFTKRMS